MTDTPTPPAAHEPDADEREALRKIVEQCNIDANTYEGADEGYVADAILASDWFAARDRAAERRGAAEALEQWVIEVTSDLAATAAADIDLGESYLHGMRSALLQAAERAEQYREDRSSE